MRLPFGGLIFFIYLCGMKRRLVKKYAWAPCRYRMEDRWMVTDDPYPIYMEECYCEKGHFDHSGYSGYGHSKEGREDECYMCPYKKLSSKEKRKYLKQCKIENRIWKQYEREARGYKNEDDLPLPF